MSRGLWLFTANAYHGRSDYKDDGTNILLDANENAYGPGLDLTADGQLTGANDSTSSLDVDLLGLNRYPDPYEALSYNAPSSPLTLHAAVTS